MGAVSTIADERAGIPSPVQGRLHFQGMRQGPPQADSLNGSQGE